MASQTFDWREIWKPIPGYPGYEASNMGRVKIGERIVNHREGKKGGWKVRLWKDGKRREHTVGRVVLLAHIGYPPEKHMCCHGPWGRKYHCLFNLSWGTNSRNMLDRQRDGTENLAFGERHYNTNLSDKDVKTILQMINDNIDRKTIAKKFQISRGVISAIFVGRNWRHIERTK
jgi:hypothetical protein